MYILYNFMIKITVRQKNSPTIFNQLFLVVEHAGGQLISKNNFEIV